MFSAVNEILGENEKLEETLNPSVFDSRYFFTYLFVAILILGIVAGTFYVSGNFELPFNPLYLLLLNVLPVLYVLKTEMRRRFIMYHFTDSKIIVEKGIFDKTWQSLYYSDITHAELVQNFEERIFDVSDLHIATAGESSMEVTLNGVKDPHRYHKKVMEGQN